MNGSLPPIISDAAFLELLDFLKITGIPGILGLGFLIMAWRDSWPWKKVK